MLDKLKPHLARLLVALPLLVAGGGVLVFALLPHLVEWQRMKSWQPVPAFMLDGNYRSQLAWADAQYVYEFEGLRYLGEGVAMESALDHLPHVRQQLGQQLKSAVRPDQTLRVWVNPDNPWQVVVNRGLRWGLFAPQLLLAVLLIGIGLWLLLKRQRRSSTRHLGLSGLQVPQKVR